MIPGIGTIPFSFITPGSQTYSTPGTYSFLVPEFNIMTVELWGGGGSGGSAYNGNTASQGGEGGSYKRYTILPGQLIPGLSQTVYVGSGGAAIQSNGGAGNYGIYSYFADAVWTIGGYGGRGQFVLQNNAPSYSPTVTVSWTLDYSEAGGAGGYVGPGANTTYSGAGGGGGQNTGGVSQAGGTSVYGGNGGQGGWSVASTFPGTAPGGGGGGTSWYQASGAGGDGRVVITWS